MKTAGVEKAYGVVETTSASQWAIDTLADLLGLSSDEEESSADWPLSDRFPVSA